MWKHKSYIQQKQGICQNDKIKTLSACEKTCQHRTKNRSILFVHGKLAVVNCKQKKRKRTICGEEKEKEKFLRAEPSKKKTRSHK